MNFRFSTTDEITTENFEDHNSKTKIAELVIKIVNLIHPRAIEFIVRKAPTTVCEIIYILCRNKAA